MLRRQRDKKTTDMKLKICVSVQENSSDLFVLMLAIEEREAQQELGRLGGYEGYGALVSAASHEG